MKRFLSFIESIPSFIRWFLGSVCINYLLWLFDGRLQLTVGCTRWEEPYMMSIEIPSAGCELHVINSLRSRWCDFWACDTKEEYNRFYKGGSSLEERVNHIRRISELMKIL